MRWISAPRRTQTASSGRGVEPLLQLIIPVGGQPAGASGVRAFEQRLRPTTVVLGDPLLDGAATDAEGLSDVGRGASLLGQHNGLESDPDAAFLGVALGPGLKLL